MPIFRYTFKKILATPSTWIIFVITVLFLMLMWLIPISFLNLSNGLELYLNSWKTLSFSIFLSFMLFVFIAVKATQVFRDEIDDGTMLILVSKPISRTRIWVEKLLSLQLIMLLYCFLALLLPTLFVIIPFAGLAVFNAIIPYLAILFGVALIFNLIFSSIAILFSLLLNVKILIVIMLGIAFLFAFFSAILVNIVTPDRNYYTQSRALAVYNNLKSNVSSDDMKWLQDNYLKNPDQTVEKIRKVMIEIYETSINKKYPAYFNAEEEQTAFKNIVNETEVNSKLDLSLVTHIYHISNVFRRNKTQSIEALMSMNAPQVSNFSSSISYSVWDMVKDLSNTFTEKEYNHTISSIKNLKIMLYLNVFYQLRYIWEGAINNNDIIKSIDVPIGDLYSINLVKTGDTYRIDLNKSNKIINFSTLLTVYILLGMALIGVSWLVFNYKDFA